MPRSTLCAAVQKGNILVSDGAWGTMLHSAGLKPGECPELWNVDHPEAVRAIAAQYIAAGAHMVETNSFGGSRFKLSHYGLQGRCGELNEAAASLSREAAGEDQWVLGSVGPTGKMLMLGDATGEELYASFREQAEALERGGADAICVETMSDIDEARIAVEAAKKHTRLEVIATFTFEKTVQGYFRTMMGVSPSDAAAAMVEAGADIIGTNCGNGFERMIPIVQEIRTAFPAIPVLVHANAGLPENRDGTDFYPDTPEYMAKRAPELSAAGASIIGGCCGTTPEHIRAIRKILAPIR